MKKYLIIIFLGVVSALHAGTYAVMDSTIMEDANGQVVQKQYYEYNNNHQYSMIRYYSLQDGQFKLYYTARYEYDIYGNYSFTEFISYSHDTVSWGIRNNYEYDNEKILWSKTYEYSKGEWVINLGYDYVYDEDGHKIKEYSSYNYDWGYTYSGLTTYTYYNGVLIADTSRNYDHTAEGWELPFRLQRYEYDNQGRVSVITQLDRYTEGWKNDEQTTYQYEDEGRYVSYIEWDYRNGNWEPERKYNVQKNNYGNTILNESYVYKDEMWIGSYKIEYNYNSSNVLEWYINYTFQDGSWIYQNKMEYDYSPSNMTISRYYLYEGAWVINQTYYSYYHEEESAIENVGMDAKFDESRPSYDTQGRRINPAEYHGVIIQDGHKFLR